MSGLIKVVRALFHILAVCCCSVYVLSSLVHFISVGIYICWAFCYVFGVIVFNVFDVFNILSSLVNSVSGWICYGWVVFNVVLCFWTSASYRYWISVGTRWCYDSLFHFSFAVCMIFFTNLLCWRLFNSSYRRFLIYTLCLTYCYLAEMLEAYYDDFYTGNIWCLDLSCGAALWFVLVQFILGLTVCSFNDIFVPSFFGFWVLFVLAPRMYLGSFVFVGSGTFGH